MVVITYAFGSYTGSLIVEDWTVALEFIGQWSSLERMTWIRVQCVPVARKN